MSELLHAGALGASALGACCAAADVARPRRRELALMVVMVLAMLDVVTGSSLLPVVWWSAAIVAISVALAVHRRRTAPAGASAMRVHAALSGIIMASLMLVMSAGHGATASGAHHGLSALGLLLALDASAVALAAAAAWQARRGHLRDRAQYASAAASLILLAAASLA